MGLIRFNLDSRHRSVRLRYELLNAVEPFRGIRPTHLLVTMTRVTGWPTHVSVQGFRILKNGADGAAADKIIWDEADAPAWVPEIIEQARRDFDT